MNPNCFGGGPELCYVTARSAEKRMMEEKGGTRIKERPLLLILAAVQFTTMVDFLIMMPLGPQYMRVFGITPAQFGFVVSAYAVSAGFAGLISGTVLDRFDRRSALLTLFTGFGLATLACALAPGYLALAAARSLAGIFGGVSGAVILAIIGDVVPEERRGRAMGLVMSSFSLASIFGVPIGLWLANLFSWHAPFLLLSAGCLPVLAAACRFVPSIRSEGHGENIPPMKRLKGILLEPAHWRAFAFMSAVTMAGFCVIPYISPYMVKNVGLKETELSYIYIAGGLCTMVSMNLVGRMADRLGKRRVFISMAVAAMLATLLLTNLHPVKTPVAIAASTLFMVCMSGRFVPAMALMTSVVENRKRGGFMGVSSAIQHLSSGVGSFAGGSILRQAADGRLHGYSTVGVLSISIALLSLALCFTLRTQSTNAFTEIAEPAV